MWSSASPGTMDLSCSANPPISTMRTVRALARLAFVMDASASARSDDERNDHHHVNEVEDDVGDHGGQDVRVRSVM